MILSNQKILVDRRIRLRFFAPPISRGIQGSLDFTGTITTDVKPTLTFLSFSHEKAHSNIIMRERFN
jgi:hypothetical protein